MSTLWTPIDGLLDVDVSRQDVDGTPKFALGTCCKVKKQGSDHVATFRYVGLAAAKTKELVYEITSDYLVTDALTTTTDNDSPLALGVLEYTTAAPVSPVTKTYGWIQTSGNFAGVTLAADCAANVDLYASSGTGILDDSSSSASLVHGIKNVGEAVGAGGAAVRECFSHCEIHTTVPG